MKEGSILITIADGFHYRYLVDTGILKEIGNGSLLVLVTLPALRSDLEDYLNDSGIKAHIISETKVNSGKLRTHLQNLYKKTIFLSSTKLSGTLNIKNELRASEGSKLKGSIDRILKNRLVNRAVVRICKKSFYDGRVYNVLRDNAVKLIITSTPAQKDFDIPYLYMAQKMGIVSISPVYSWDNLSAKGPFYFNPSFLIVWNDVMRQEAVEYHAYQHQSVFACGVPVFDEYPQIIEESLTRSDFLTSLNLDPALPLITLTTIPQIYYGSSHLYLAEKLVAARCKSLPNFNLLIRPHPMDETVYSSLSGIQNVVVDNYGSIPDKSLTHWKPAKDNVLHLGRTMKHSDVVLNVASTITIDAACFDTPVVNISFDIKRTPDDYVGSISRYYQYTHYKHVTDSQASALAKSEGEMIEFINLYLKEPKTHSERRLELVKQQVLKLDGLSYKRIAETINELATR